jgi:hypothetical protein
MVLLAYNIADLQEKIRVVEAYFAKNGLLINLQKAKVVMFQNGMECRRNQCDGVECVEKL